LKTLDFLRGFSVWLHVWLHIVKNRLTVAKIRALEPQAKRYKVTDSHGLAIEVRPNGRMCWRWRYRHRGRPAEITLGRYPQMCVADARKRRDALLIGILEGKSPAEQRKADQQAELRGATVQAFTELWLKRHVSRYRKDLAPIRRYLARDVFPVIGRKPLASIEKKDFREIVYAKIDAGRPQAALALRNILKRLWDYAVECEITDKSSDVVIPKAKYVAEVSSRSRALKPAEIGPLLRGLEAARLKPELKDALLLILLTLVRKSELRLAHWTEFDLERGEWALPEEHSKMDTPLVIPLARQAVEALRRQRERQPHASIVFPMRGATHTPMAKSTLNRALARVEQLAKIEHFTVHDLRRTAATNLAELEYDEAWIEKALNHNKKGVAGIYNRAQYAKQRRDMLQAWADWLDEAKTNK
jgi:integrase